MVRKRRATLELAVRGDAARVSQAMAWVREEIGKLGYPFSERPAKPAPPDPDWKE